MLNNIWVTAFLNTAGTFTILWSYENEENQFSELSLFTLYILQTSKYSAFFRIEGLGIDRFMINMISLSNKEFTSNISKY